jgi:hypothetical protein
MADPTKAELIWNRALGTEPFRMLKGDLALYHMLFVNGYAANGGVFHAVEMDATEELADGIEAYRYFGLDEAADLLDQAKLLFEAGEDVGPLEEKFNKKYYAVTDDGALFKRLEAVLLLRPTEFAPV